MKKIRLFFNELNQQQQAIITMLFASLFFAIMGACVKILSKGMGAFEIVFYRNLAGVILIGLSVYKRPLKNSGGRPGLLFFRGFIGFVALAAYFYDIGYIPLSKAITYNKTSPIFTAFLAWFFLKERLRPANWIALLIGFAGIIMIIQPDTSGISKYDLLGIFSGFGAAASYTAVRSLSKYYDTRTIVLSLTLTGTIGPLLLIANNYINLNLNISGKIPFLSQLVIRDFSIPAIKYIPFIILMGASATVAQLLMTRAFQMSKAGIVGAVIYMNVIFSLFIGMALGDAFPDYLSLIGMFCVIGGGILNTLQKS